MKNKKKQFNFWLVFFRRLNNRLCDKDTRRCIKRIYYSKMNFILSANRGDRSANWRCGRRALTIFWRRGGPDWLTVMCPSIKMVRNFWKNLHAIWCIILHLFHKKISNLVNFNVWLFSVIIWKKMWSDIKKYLRLKCTVVCLSLNY